MQMHSLLSFFQKMKNKCYSHFTWNSILSARKCRRIDRKQCWVVVGFFCVSLHLLRLLTLSLKTSDKYFVTACLHVYSGKWANVYDNRLKVSLIKKKFNKIDIANVWRAKTRHSPFVTFSVAAKLFFVLMR